MTSDRYAHRRTHATIAVQGLDGTPLANREVRVAQLQHAFQFGCTSPSMRPEDEQQRQLWLDLFDTATLPSFYWGRYEPRPGETARDEVMATARWLVDRGVRLKGHPLVWHTVKAPWVDQLPLAEAEATLRARIRREVADFAGVVDVWDVINEAVIMPRFTNEPDGVPNVITKICAEKGRVDMVRMAVDEARSVGTRPFLILNDFDLGPEYEQLVEDVLAAGVEIDAIGLQSHMHQGFRGEKQITEINDRFARFELPLHWTETTLVSGDLMPADIVDLNDFVVDDWPTTPEGEARQADEIVRHYTTLVSHPAVEAVTYWGMEDARAWLGAPCGLVRKDGSPKPAYEALRDLVRGEWWYAPQTLRTDAEGRLTINGFAGQYEVSAGDAGGTVSLAPGKHQPTVTVARA